MEYQFRRSWKGFPGIERPLKEGVGSRRRDAHSYRAKSVSLRTECEQGLNGKRELALEWRTSDESHTIRVAWEAQAGSRSKVGRVVQGLHNVEQGGTQKDQESGSR